MTDIIDFITDLRYEHIPEDALQSARLCLLDGVGCMVGGMQNMAVMDLARNISAKYPGNSRIAGTALTGSRPWAAFVNSHACSYFDLDDGHRKAQGHPGGIIVPLSFMLAAENNLSGKDLLTAIVAGYETAVRSAVIIRESGGPRKGSGGWGITGAVAALAKLANMSRDQVKNALGLAEYYAPQAPQDRSLAYPSSMKEGMAWAAYLAPAIVELAEIGFDAMSPFVSGSRHCRDLGDNWEICSTYYKMYGCCRFSHPVLDGLQALRDDGVKPGEIETIKVTSFGKAMLLNHLEPENPVAAMYSIPFIIGCFLTKGKIGPDEMNGDTLADKDILAISQKVVLEEDSEITAQFPLKCLARVTVTLNNGKAFESGTLSAKGDPDNPYSINEMRDKFLGLTETLTGNTGENLYKQLTGIENESVKNIWDGLR